MTSDTPPPPLGDLSTDFLFFVFFLFFSFFIISTSFSRLTFEQPIYFFSHFLSSFFSLLSFCYCSLSFCFFFFFFLLLLPNHYSRFFLLSSFSSVSFPPLLRVLHLLHFLFLFLFPISLALRLSFSHSFPSFLLLPLPLICLLLPFASSLFLPFIFLVFSIPLPLFHPFSLSSKSPSL